MGNFDCRRCFLNSNENSEMKLKESKSEHINGVNSSRNNTIQKIKEVDSNKPFKETLDNNIVIDNINKISKKSNKSIKFKSNKSVNYNNLDEDSSFLGDDNIISRKNIIHKFENYNNNDDEINNKETKKEKIINSEKEEEDEENAKYNEEKRQQSSKEVSDEGQINNEGKEQKYEKGEEQQYYEEGEEGIAQMEEGNNNYIYEGEDNNDKIY